MSFPFDPSHGPILVKAEVTGPDRSLALQLILDTGATTSLLNDAVLLTLGYDLASVTDRVQMTTGSLVTSVQGTSVIAVFNASTGQAINTSFITGLNDPTGLVLAS